MEVKKGHRIKSDENVLTESGHCPKCATPIKFTKKPNPLMVLPGKAESQKVSVKSPDCGYVMQIVNTGLRPDNVYEARILLSPEVDMSSIKITVKGNNLRVNVCKPLGDRLFHLPEIVDKSSASDIMKRMMKHCENLLIPDGIDSAKVRAVVDNKNRTLVLTAPEMKPSKAEMDVKGLKVGTATLATENVLNIKLHSADDWSQIRNINFLIPAEANAEEVSIEIFKDTILMRAPLNEKHT